MNFFREVANAFYYGFWEMLGEMGRFLMMLLVVMAVLMGGTVYILEAAKAAMGVVG